MSRLVVAVLILFAVLIGLRVAHSSSVQLPFQLNFLNQSDNPASDTRNTGFSADSSGATSSNRISQASLNAPNQGSTAPTTALPPQTQPPVPAGW